MGSIQSKDVTPSFFSCPGMKARYLGWILDLEANRKMNKVKIQVVQLEIFQGLVQAHRDVLWGKIGTPQLFKKKKKNRSGG